MKKPFVSDRIERLAKTIHAKVLMEPDYGFVGHIVFKNGKTTFFRDTCFNINKLGSIEIAKDKGYASFFLKKFKFSVPKYACIFNEKINKNVRVKKGVNEGSAFAQKIGFPIIVKPNNASQGIGVTKVYSAVEYAKIAKELLKNHSVLILQEFCEGNDYRIVVLDNQVISAYQRLPLAVIGDGMSSVKQLLERKQKDFIKSGRDTKLDFKDTRILQNLKRQRLSMNSKIKAGVRLQLLDNANLSGGGDAIDCTNDIHLTFKKLAVDITKKMGLRLCGVDIITADITMPAKKYFIIEINAAPGLDNYASMGDVQEKIVDGLYLKVLKALEK